MRYVYMIRSRSRPDQRYVGITADLSHRLKEHNSGKSPHTAKYRPWQIVAAIQFTDEQRASEFERYLKSGSGSAFANKHFW